MAKIVLISDGTKHDNNNIGDIVAIHDDDVELGLSYNSFKIVELSGTAEQVRVELEKKIPEISIIDEKEYYTNSKDELIEVKEKPKYSLRIEQTTKDETLTTLSSKTTANVITLNEVSKIEVS